MFDRSIKRVRLLFVVTSLALLATALHLIFLDFRVNHITTLADYSVKRTFESDPFITTSSMVADLFCSVGEPCREVAVAIDRGFYLRTHLPPMVAVVGGLVVPYIMLVIAAFLLGGMLVGWARIVAACLSFAAGFWTFTPAVVQDCSALRYYGISGVWAQEYFAIDLIWTIVGLTLLIAAAWLFARAYRARKRRAMAGHPP